MNNQVNEAKININSTTPLADGRCKLMLIFSYDGERFRMDTGERCLPENFDRVKQRVTRKHPFQIETNSILNRLCTEVVAEYKRFKLKGVIPSREQLKKAIKPKREKDIEITNQDIGYYFDLLQRKQIVNGISKATQSNYKTLRSRLALYERDRKIKLTFKDFDSIRHTDFMEWLIYEKNNHPNTIAKRNQCLKHFFDFCADDNNVEVNPFYKKIKIVTVETQTIFLEERELKILEELNIDSYLEKTRDCYLFACYTGRRYSEVAEFTYDQLSVNEQGLEVMTFYEDKKIKKGNLVVALNDKALAIINKYRTSNIYSKRKKHVLPVMTNQRFNKYLKELGNMAGINTPIEKIIYEQGIPRRIVVPKYELMDFHTARHTYATLSIQRGMDIEILQKELNHSKIDQTLHYAKIVKSFQHKQALKAWNTEEETEVEIETEPIKRPAQSNDQFEKIKTEIKNAVQSKKTELEVLEELEISALEQLQKMGFLIKETSPIQKLENLYHIISW